MPEFTPKFIAGMILLVTNQPVGWGGIIYCSYLAKKTGKKIYLGIGTALYIISWGMLGLGVLLAGPEGMALAKQLFKTYGWKILPVVLVIAAAVLIILKRRKKNEKKNVS